MNENKILIFLKSGSIGNQLSSKGLTVGSSARFNRLEILEIYFFDIFRNNERPVSPEEHCSCCNQPELEALHLVIVIWKMTMLRRKKIMNIRQIFV